MESSAISLYFSLLRRSSPDAAPEQREYLINLIDSPGHIDFSSEVSTASRLCDGAVVLVDAVEGVCSQTITVLRQTWVEKLKPLLVINKMDRLITELKMSPQEAYTHLGKLIEQVNAVMGSFFQGERMMDDLNWRERVEERVNAVKEEDTTSKGNDSKPTVVEDEEGVSTTDASAEYEEKDDEDIYFGPENNNVIFSSAIDGWAFTPRQFAALYEKKLGIKRSILEKVLWGDFYLDPKTKRVLSSKHLKGRHLKPMFVQLVLENIWAVYEATMGGNNGKGCVQFFYNTLQSIHAWSSSLHDLSATNACPTQRSRTFAENNKVTQHHHSSTHLALSGSPSPTDSSLPVLASSFNRTPGLGHRTPSLSCHRSGCPYSAFARRFSWFCLY